jgi:hypothetical protein
MAYRDEPEARHVPYNSSHDRTQNDRSQYSKYEIPPRSRSRADSHASSDYQPRDRSPGSNRRSFDTNQPQTQQPLKTAIGNAFDKSDAARVVDPDLIAQITEEVKKSVLNEIKFARQQQQPVPASPQYYVPHSPTSTSASLPPRDVYTPPSPKHADFPHQASPASDPLSRDLDGNDDTPKPRYEKSAPIDIPQERTTRPGPTPRMATDDYTPIEKMWQRLFDPDDQPLPRLGEFLRGLALHLVCNSRKSNDHELTSW